MRTSPLFSQTHYFFTSNTLAFGILICGRRLIIWLTTVALARSFSAGGSLARISSIHVGVSDIPVTIAILGFAISIACRFDLDSKSCSMNLRRRTSDRSSFDVASNYLVSPPRHYPLVQEPLQSQHHSAQHLPVLVRRHKSRLFLPLNMTRKRT